MVRCISITAPWTSRESPLPLCPIDRLDRQHLAEAATFYVLMLCDIVSTVYLTMHRRTRLAIFCVGISRWLRRASLSLFCFLLFENGIQDHNVSIALRVVSVLIARRLLQTSKAGRSSSTGR